MMAAMAELMTDATRLILCALLLVGCTTDQKTKGDLPAERPAPVKGEALATFAGGCFWCMEPPFEGQKGVQSVVSGYSGGTEQNPTYKQVSRGKTSHTEAVQIVYDPSVISYERLLEIFWRSMDPTDASGQFADRGPHYRPEIFVHDAAQRKTALASKEALGKSGVFDKPIVVTITDYDTFWPAEGYHQDYYKTNTAHYKRYRKGSGREGFLKKTWGADEKTSAEVETPTSKPTR